MPRAIYPSDITQDQFEIIRPQLENFKKTTKPRQLSLYDIFCGVLYVLKSSCQWRMLPSDFPKWGTVYSYFRQWNHKPELATGETEGPLSVLEKLLYEHVAAWREADGRDAKTTLGIVDAQSVKNTDTADEKGYDAGKKVSGIKRHIVVDTNGLPHAIVVTTANVTDREGALQAFSLHCSRLSEVQKVMVDGGYTGKPFTDAVKSILSADVEVAKRNELHTFAVIPKRWVVECSFAWLEKCRRLWKNCEGLVNTSLQMVVLAFLILLLKRSGFCAGDSFHLTELP
jgi:transposase